MSSDEPPTTPAEMELLAVLDDALLDAHEVELQHMALDAILGVNAAAERFRRGEMPEPERQEWLRVLDVTGPAIEAVLRKNQEMIDRNRESHG